MYLRMEGHRGTAALLEYLEAKEQELGRPIRVLDGAGRTITATTDRWSGRQVEACEGYSVDECLQRGITIVMWGTTYPNSFYVSELREETRALLFNDPDGLETYDGMVLYDTIVMPYDETSWTTDPIVVGDLTCGDYGTRMICLFHPFAHYSTLRWDVLLDEALANCIDEDLAAARAERLVNLQRERFVTYATRANSRAVQDLEQTIGATMNRVTEYQELLANQRHQLRDNQRRLDMLKAAIDSIDEGAAVTMWQRLHEDERIERIEFNADAGILTIHTAGLNLRHPRSGQEVYLGKFRWIITPNNGHVEATNLDNARGGYDHPHIYMNRPCFGEMGNTIHQLLMQGQLYPAIEMIFAFLATINLNDDWARRAAFWFEDDEDSPRNTEIRELVTA